MEKNKALFIDVFNRSVTEIELPKHYLSISKQIGNGCELFCCPISFENDDSLYADDESLLRLDDCVGGFKFNDWSYPLVGNAVILGTDEEGDSCDVKTKVEEITSRIEWIGKDECIRYANEVLSRGSQIYFF